MSEGEVMREEAKMRQASHEGPSTCHVRELGFIFRVKDGVKCKPGSDFCCCWSLRCAGKCGQNCMLGSQVRDS